MSSEQHEFLVSEIRQAAKTALLERLKGLLMLIYYYIHICVWVT